MKKIQEPKDITAIRLKPADMNKIHFGGDGTPITPAQLASMADGK